MFSDDFSAPLALILKLLWQSSLLQDRIRRVSRFDLTIDYKVNLCNRTTPNFMVAFADAHKLQPAASGSRLSSGEKLSIRPRVQSDGSKVQRQLGRR
jgi:hypothetical protein